MYNASGYSANFRLDQELINKFPSTLDAPFKQNRRQKDYVCLMHFYPAIIEKNTG